MLPSTPVSPAMSVMIEVHKQMCVFFPVVVKVCLTQLSFPGFEYITAQME